MSNQEPQPEAPSTARPGEPSAGGGGGSGRRGRTFTREESRRGGQAKRGYVSPVKREMKDFFRNFFESEEYRRSLKRRILAGEANHVELYGLQIVYGKPRDRVQVESPPSTPGFAAGFRLLPREEQRRMFELARRAMQLARDGVVEAEAAAVPAGEPHSAGGP